MHCIAALLLALTAPLVAGTLTLDRYLADVRAANPELHILSKAWLATTIAMPPASALLQPQVMQAPPHREVAREQPSPAAPLANAAAVPAGPRRGYPEAVILRALQHGDSAFGRCWSRANRRDSVAPPRKARLHLEIDSAGVVRSASTEMRWPASTAWS